MCAAPLKVHAYKMQFSPQITTEKEPIMSISELCKFFLHVYELHLYAVNIAYTYHYIFIPLWVGSAKGQDFLFTILDMSICNVIPLKFHSVSYL